MDSLWWRTWLTSAEQVLSDRAQGLNALNLFPVPDSDTGSNMAGTLARIRESRENSSFADFAESAMNNARGNSGTLLSVWLNSLAPFVHDDAQSAVRCVEGFAAAARVAEKSLSTPVEGTMLTVMKAIGSVKNLDDARDCAEQTVRETTSILPALSETNVVDAGALGFLYVINALAQVAGQPSRAARYDAEFLTAHLAVKHRQPHASKDSGVEVMATVTADLLTMSTLRNSLEAMGDSLSIARVGNGEPARWAVHVHVTTEEAAISALQAAGEVENLRTTSLGH